MDDKRIVTIKSFKLKIKEVRKDFLEVLTVVYSIEEARSFFYLLTEHFLGLRRVDVAMQLDRLLSDSEIESFEDAKHRLQKQEPIQYIIGETDFYGLKYKVNQHVLIPRPETEELVDWILKDIKERSEPVRILDIGTGSGCIAISLAKNKPNAKVTAIDVSKEALDVAIYNAQKNDVDVTFACLDILEVNSEKLSDFDIIVSNPPYVRVLEKAEMKPNVLDNEPLLALFVENDTPLLFYDKITRLAKKKLTPNGVLYFEINQYLGNETKDLIENLGLTEVELRKDLYGNDRMIKAFKTNI